MVHRYVSGRRQSNWYNLLIIIAVSFGSMLYGYTLSATAPILAQPTFLQYFGLETQSNGRSLLSTFNGIFQAGGFLGVFLVSWIADKYGQKVGIAVPAVILIITAALMEGSTNVGVFIVWRSFAGAGTFVMLVAVPIYMTEVVPPVNRGMLVNIHGAALLLGYTCVIWTGYGIYFWNDNDNDNWRLLFGECFEASEYFDLPSLAFQAAFPLTVISLLPILPETPRWLAMKNRVDEARGVLDRLHTPEEAHLELDQICKELEVDKNLPCSYVESLTESVRCWHWERLAVSNSLASSSSPITDQLYMVC